MADDRQKFDIAIVGAGPAGSSSAIRLARAGLKALIVEQKKFPRSKLCGEFISPECLEHFADLGVLEKMEIAGGVPLERTIFFARNGRSVTVPSEWFAAGSHALGLSRAEMDAQLLSRAREAGASVMEETAAANLLWDAGNVIGLELRGRSGNRLNVTAGLTIDATGRSKILARMVERSTSGRIGSKAEFVAFKTHLSNAAIPQGDCEIYAYRGGYGGCSRVENGLNNLCFIVSADIAKRFGGNAETILHELLFTNKQARRSLANAKVADNWLAVPIENYGR